MNGAEIGKFVRARRLAMDMSQTDLASRAGISGGALSKIERGSANRMSLETAEGIAFGLRISVSEIASAGRGVPRPGSMEDAAVQMLARIPAPKLRYAVECLEKWVDDGKAKR